MIKHNPLCNTDKVCQLYSEKDGVPITYVCTTALNDGTTSIDVFYRKTPHPQFGNRYFGLYRHPITENLMITNADVVEDLEFACVEDDDGNLQYSSDRWDYKLFENGNMIDGGRAYTRTSGCKVYTYHVQDGQMVVK